MNTKLPPKPAKKKTRFGSLPDDDSTTLAQPEHAPAAPAEATAKKARKKTGRTVPFGTRVTEEFREDFDRLAFEDKLKNVELLEAMKQAYKEKTGRL